MWYQSWTDLIRVILVGAAAYAFLIIVLRATGKRTLAQLNAFDFVVSVSLGSVLATILLSADVSWTEGATALLLLAALQFAVAWISTRWPRVRTVIANDPSVLFANGTYRSEALRRNRLTESEIRAAVRQQGIGDLAAVKAVVLESSGQFSVITADSYGTGSALEGVQGREGV